MFYLHLIALVLSSTGIGTAVAANTTAQHTHEFSLSNGLKVIVRADHRAPVVTSQLWYKVGSSYETSGATGLSHALEHMMFLGSQSFAPGEASRILKSFGAEENAFTSADYTAYYQTLARDRLSIALALEADRMRSLQLPANEFKREIEVIKEERRMRTDDNPFALAYERFKAIAYPDSGYGNPAIGWMADLKRMQIDQLRDWYHQWYAPNNATLVIVGDISLTEVKALTEQYFGSIPARAVPSARQPLELPEPGERQLFVHVDTELPSIIMGFNVPSLTTGKDLRLIHALRLINGLLDGGHSARMPIALERDYPLASSAGAKYDPFTRGDSLFVLSATVNPARNSTLAELEKALWSELHKLQHSPPEASELARVRAQAIAELVYARDSISGQAMAIGQLESIGLSWQVMEEDITALQAVTPADIQKAAQTYFTQSRLSTAQVLPKGSADE